ncbi:hypothetical protein FGD67_15365 [Colwellia sp. M166]|jgi:hypothetical protein|uniref:hypothetical protein n=1 Tax=Colwellia sp. M166 TaxID=2583805 RepID=UPI00211DD047|nr:hypothetical protein [Colwellia sp. M166]UUO24450.1 hypothetical protein FGD67_15365 [Colwellia sp. M166]|tara:strand:+ start:1375 stop:1692 length:318 start_codon:yes stop_codon:yes gene_type:complete
MKKIALLSVVLSASILSGCMATGEDSINIAEVDFNTLSCEQIDTVFKDYKSNVDSGDNMSSLLGSLSSEAASAAKAAKSTAMTAYYSAKEVAGPAMKVKGCNINI